MQVVAEMWFEDLDGSMNASTFNEAVSYYRKEYNRMPRPADLIRISRDAGHQSQAFDKVVLDGITGRYKWHDDPDGTEYISLKEFKRRRPDYAKKLEGLGDRFGNLLKSLPDHVIYDDRLEG